MFLLRLQSKNSVIKNRFNFSFCSSLVLIDISPTNMYLFSVDGGWNSWGEWSACDSNQQKKRTRHCNRPSPINGGAPCSGNGEESDDCPGVLMLVLYRKNL